MSSQDESGSRRNRPLVWFILIVGTCVTLFFLGWQAGAVLPPQDLASYWAAAHLLKQNPYSPELVSAFETSCGLRAPNPPLIMRNPPWALALALPLRLISYRVAFALWTMMSVVAVIACTRAVWKLFGAPESLGTLLLPVLFGPTMVLIMLGQWSVVVLIGVAVFLLLIERQRPLLAGTALLLVIGKPHVVLLFLIAVLLWTFRARRWAVLVGAVIATTASSLLVLAINPGIFRQFLDQILHIAGERVLYPNMGGLLYYITGQHFMALLPQALGVIWLVFYWRRHRDQWDWKREGMLVLAVSVACSYYSYGYDEVLVLPALIGAFLNGNRKVFLACFVATNIGYALYLFQIVGSLGFSYMFLSWTSTAWLITYAASTMVPQVQAKSMAEQN
jgi:hypothetical protein